MRRIYECTQSGHPGPTASGKWETGRFKGFKGTLIHSTANWVYGLISLPLPLHLPLRHEMASIVGVSSMYKTHTLKLLKRPTTTTASVSLDNEPRLNALLLANHNNRPRIRFITSAIATTNSSVLTKQEEAFKGFGSNDVNGDGQFGYDYEADDTPVTVSNDELDISKLGLPSQLVASLHKRGITSLFPIQVFIIFFLKFYFILLSSVEWNLTLVD